VAKRKNPAKSEDGATLGFEVQLWLAADKLRNSCYFLIN